MKREQILDAVWGPDYDGTYRTVDTIVKQIRIKLSDENYKYYTKIVDVTDKKTWIYNYI